MTVTMAEFLAEGWSEEELLSHWESYNSSWQRERYVRNFVLTPRTLHHRWRLMEVHDFCWKSCAMYATVDGIQEMWLFEYLWKKWFRGRETPCRFRNFVAKLVRTNEPDSPKSVAELKDAHRAICAQVSRRQIVLDEEDAKAKHGVIDEVEDHEDYKLQGLFRAIFVVLDTKFEMDPETKGQGHRDIPEDTPVLLIRTGDNTDLALGSVDFRSIEEVSHEVEGNYDVRRIGLGDAVDFVLNMQRMENQAALAKESKRKDDNATS